MVNGEAITKDVSPGEHKLRFHNTLVWKTIGIDLKPGEHARYVVTNRAGRGTSALVATLGVGPIYLKIDREVGFLLASVGLYGLLSEAVGERRREFGIRLAVGASNSHIAGLVLRQAAWTSFFGTIGGVALAYWGSALLKPYLFGVSEFDPAVYAAAAAILGVVVVVASIRPAWSAARVNPIETLRAE